MTLILISVNGLGARASAAGPTDQATRCAELLSARTPAIAIAPTVNPANVQDTLAEIAGDFYLSTTIFQHYSDLLRTNGGLTSIPELRPLVAKLSKLLDSDQIVRLSESDQVVSLLRKQLKTSLFHLDLQFVVRTADYPYDAPFNGPFPYRPTIEAIDDCLNFFELLKKSGLPHPEITTDSSRLTWFSLLAKLPARQRSGSGLPIDSDAANHTAESVRKIVENPVAEYVRYQHRLRDLGENAPFPEFKPSVDRLLSKLDSEEVADLVNSNTVLEHFRKSAHESLTSIASGKASKTRVSQPFEQSYPYRPTIRAIVQALRFFDIVERLKYPVEADQKAVELSWMLGQKEGRKIEPLYHFDRYSYHWYSLIEDSSIVLFPTIEPLGFTQLIKVRSVPIGFLGVETETVRVDRHFQTPLDFWYHDVNHVRRMTAYTERLIQHRSAFSEEERIGVYEESDRLLQTLIQGIALPDKPKQPSNLMTELGRKSWQDQLEAWNDERSKRRIARAIIFEIVHETAKAADRESILGDLLRMPNTPQPFEYMSLAGDGTNNVETLRTVTGNLQSGATGLGPFKDDGPVYVQYFNDRALSLLSNVYNKLIHGFYDSVYDPKAYIVPAEYRSPEHLASGAEYLFELLGAAPPPRKVLLEMIESHEGSPEKYDSYISIHDLKAD